jgi:hypothetical protein
MSQGDFLDIATSPNDPLWFSHHANLDRLFYLWMKGTGNLLANTSDPCGGFYSGDSQYPQVS